MSSNEPEKRSTVVDGLIDFYRTSPFNFGAADIFCFGPFDTIQRIGEILFLLFMIRDENNRCPIHQFNVILPPSGSRYDEAGIREGFGDAVARLRGTPLSSKERESLGRRLRIFHSADLQCRSVCEILQQLPRNSAVIVCDATKYRDEAIEADAVDAGAARLDEDIWVKQLQRLAQEVVTEAKRAESYVMLDAGQFRPHRTTNIDILTSVEDCGVLCAELSNDPAAIIAQYGDDWIAAVRSGRVGHVLASIDALPASMNRHKDAIKIQMFQHADLLPQAIELIHAELKSEWEISGELRVKYARVAEESGDDDLAIELLAPAIALLDAQEWLETALLLSSKIGDRAIEQECSQRLGRLFPDSHYLHRHQIGRLMRSRDYKSLLEMLATPLGGIATEETEYYVSIASALEGDSRPDYEALLGKVAARWPDFIDRARRTCARDAMARGFLNEALSLAAGVVLEGPSARQSAWVLLEVIEQLLIRRDDKGQLAIAPKDMRGPILTLVRYLANNPGDGGTRLAVCKLLSVQLTGTYGLPVIAAATLNLLEVTPRKIAADRHDYPLTARPDFDDIKPFFKAALTWLSDQKFVLLGRTPLPATLITGSPDELLATIIRMIEHAGNRLSDETDFDFIEKLLAVGSGLVPHTTTPNADLILISLVGDMYVLAGRVQKARDLAELALQLAGNNPARMRLAWYAFSDIYQRLGNYMESLVAMACALSCDGDITADQAWREANALVRLLRDLNMIEFARSVLPYSRQFARDLGIEEANRHRFATIELGIRFSELLRRPATADEMKDFIAAVNDNCLAVLDAHDELPPVATLLGQSIMMARTLGFSIETGPAETLDRALSEMGGSAASMIRTISEQEPSATQVLALASRLEPARHSEDTGFDVRMAVLAARRLLASNEAARNASVAAFAIEMLADHGVRHLAAEGLRQSSLAMLPSKIEEPAEIAIGLSADGLAIHLLGVTNSGRLARVTAVSGVLHDTVFEEDGTFSPDAIEKWGAEFPYRYGFEADNPNLFYRSMRDIGVTIPPFTRNLLVMDTSLQQLPPNLVLASDEFAGGAGAVAAAPSLSWLRDARLRTRRPGKSVAWIPISTVEGADQTLATLADRLNDPFEKHGIVLRTGAGIPDDLSASELAIVTAHGGIVPEGRFFQVVADDGILKLTTAMMSTAVKDAGLVILFVCSAGRFDKHPLANTTVGLAKELLDRGCSAVIASPWPLHASVPAYWLPAFLEAWAAGLPVIDGNFEANKAVAKALGDSPAYRLAMSVFGDPLLRKPK